MTDTNKELVASGNLPSGDLTIGINSDFKRMPVRCDSQDPNACGHCHEFLAIPGEPNCPLHTTTSEISITRTNLYNLKRTEVSRRLQTLKNHPEARSLTNELGLLRLMLEELLNSCKDNYDLVLQEAAIGRLITNINATLTTSVKIEERVGELLSVDHVVTLIQMFFEIIKEYITDIDTQEAIAVRINALIEGKSYTNDSDLQAAAAQANGGSH